MDLINDSIQTTLNSFDFSYCFVVNLLTYFIIKIIDELNGDKVITTWQKRLVLLFSILFIGIVHYISDVDSKTIINSAILAPVSWSWIFKPLFSKLGIDYKHFD